MQTPQPAAPAPRVPLTGYQLRLIGFLSVATFFEGYDFFAVAQILPSLRAEFGISPGQAGALIAVINSGTILAAFLLRKADQWGRRRVLTITIIGYTSCSLLTALAPDVWTFGAAQLLARLFLIGEWGIAMVYAAEEFPADRRGLVIGVIQACSSLGGIACAGVVPVLLTTSIGWRAVYVIGAVPLLIIAVARRNLKETARFTGRGRGLARPAAAHGDPADSVPPAGAAAGADLGADLHLHPERDHLLEGIRGRGARLHQRRGGGEPDDRGAGLDARGLLRRQTPRSAGPARRGADHLHRAVGGDVPRPTPWRAGSGLTAALVLGIFGSSAVLPVLNAYTAELFPTPLRSGAFAWANNLLGRLGYVLSPLGVGIIASSQGWGPAVSLTTIFPLLALALIWLLLPETKGRELEETSALPQPAGEPAVH